MADLPTHHNAAICEHEPNSAKYHFSIQSLPLPTLTPTDLLIRLTVTGICGSDYALASGELGPTKSILGHEGIGRVVAHGTAISPSEIPLNARVGVAWIRDICGSCVSCLTDGGETRCQAFITSGRVVDGTFAEYVVVPARYVIRLPDGGPGDEQLAPILCAGVTVYKAIKVCGATPGSWIAISGAGGGVGALGIQYAKAMGYRVIGIDAGAAKESFCLGLGAEVFVDAAAEPDVPAAVIKLTDGGVMAAICAVGSARAYAAALNMLAPFGTLVCVGVPPPDGLVSFHPRTFIGKGIRIIGSAVGTRGDILEAVEFVRRGVVKPKVTMTSWERLGEIGEEYEKGTIIGKYVIRFRDD